MIVGAGDGEYSVTPGVIGQMNSQDGIDVAGPLCRTGANGVRGASAVIKSLNKTGQKVPF